MLSNRRVVKGLHWLLFYPWERKLILVTGWCIEVLQKSLLKTRYNLTNIRLNTLDAQTIISRFVSLELKLKPF